MESVKDKIYNTFEVGAYISMAAAGVALVGSLALSGKKFDTIQSKAETVPEKDKKELVLKYDEKLLHNIDSLTNEGISTNLAIKKAHTITWEQASELMAENSDEWSGEDCVVCMENISQQDKSARIMQIGKTTHISYRENYPEELRQEIAKKQEELREYDVASNTQINNMTNTTQFTR